MEFEWRRISAAYNGNSKFRIDSDMDFVGHSIYLFSGNKASQRSLILYKLDSLSHTWSEMEYLEISCGGHSIALVGDKILLYKMCAS